MVVVAPWVGCLSPVRMMVATSGGAWAPNAPPQFRYITCRALDVGKFRESVGTDIEVRQPGFYQSGDLRGVPADGGGTPCFPDGFTYGPGARGETLPPFLGMSGLGTCWGKGARSCQSERRCSRWPRGSPTRGRRRRKWRGGL